MEVGLARGKRAQQEIETPQDKGWLAGQPITLQKSSSLAVG